MTEAQLIYEGWRQWEIPRLVWPWSLVGTTQVAELLLGRDPSLPATRRR